MSSLPMNAGLRRPSRWGERGFVVDAASLSSIIMALGALSLVGCFAQAGLGAQRSPGGGWSGSGEMIGGINFELGERVAFGVGAHGAIAGYRSGSGGGYSVPGPIVLATHVRAAGTERNTLAVVAEIALPLFSSVNYETDGGDERDIAEPSSMRWALGVGHHRRWADDPGITVRTTLGLESFVVRGAAPFDDVVTLGPAASIGIALTADALGTMFDKLTTKD